MTEQTFTAPLMGAFHRMKDINQPVPAVGILSVLPVNFPFYLQREPDNAFDENAVKVLLRTEDLEDSVDMEKLEEAIMPYGFSGAELYQEEFWHIGYISKEFAIHLTKLLEPEDTDYSASLTFFTDDRGRQKNAVQITMDIEEE